jgi:ribosomal protein S18 acetylase RimI-like enzyme
VIGLSDGYRGRSSLGLRLGDLVLEDVLRSINQSWGGTPHIFALVDPDNRASRNLFERNGFRMIIPANGNGHEADSLFRRIGGQIPS